MCVSWEHELGSAWLAIRLNAVMIQNLHVALTNVFIIRFANRTVHSALRPEMIIQGSMFHMPNMGPRQMYLILNFYILRPTYGGC